MVNHQACVNHNLLFMSDQVPLFCLISIFQLYRPLQPCGLVKILNSSAFLIYNPGTVVPMLEAAMSVVPVEKLAVHFHDTYGQSLSNILISLQVTN